MVADKLESLINKIALDIQGRVKENQLSELELKIILWNLFNQAYAIVRKELYGE